jgi:cell division septum initiation protein DivIVA
VTDGWMKARTKGQHEPEPGVPVMPPSPGQQPPVPQSPGQQLPVQDPRQGGDVQQAMQMLTLAQRTADEHVAAAYRQAGTIEAEARATAERVLREAQEQADQVRREADAARAEARAQAEQAATDAQAQVEAARRDGEQAVGEARSRAEEIGRTARAQAEELHRQSRQRYDDEVGHLAAKREALQRQIESLQEFDRDYRSRLLTFMQAQLRALWAEQPRVVDGDVSLEDLVPLPRPEGSRPDAARPEAAHPEAAQPQTAQPEAARPDAGRPDAARPEGARPEGARPDLFRAGSEAVSAERG